MAQRTFGHWLWLAPLMYVGVTSAGAKALRLHTNNNNSNNNNSSAHILIVNVVAYANNWTRLHFNALIIVSL